ncbi:MAG: MBL fold metallo-hydrolase [Alphaproteobacteria bacterium]|nr:MBL fold metallo-hydrolase [Alphaproteobacteria bacterium]
MKTQAKTRLVFVGGLNKDRIGGNCHLLEHQSSDDKTVRLMFDLGSVFPHASSGFSNAYPDVRAFFDRINPKTETFDKAQKPVDALFITHAHQDHIGALISYAKMGYQLPPIYSSKTTNNVIRLFFAKEGLEPPETVNVEREKPVRFQDCVEVEAFDVSHSAVDALGFHSLTLDKGEPVAAVVHNGDFSTDEQMPIGQSFSKKDYLSLIKRKPAPQTIFLFDSTSVENSVLKRIGFEQAVQNTLDVCLQNQECNIIVSPVITGSFNNAAIDFEVAKRLKTKVFLDGYGLKIFKDALKLSGHTGFDELIYHGNMQKYLKDESVSLKYIVCTGAFGQGLNEYKHNIGISPTSAIWLSSAAKMALDLHPDLKVSKKCLFLMRQHFIEEICSNRGNELCHRLAAQGATVVIAPSKNKIGDFTQVQMQDSGHIGFDEMCSLAKDIQTIAENMVIVPVHGSNAQRKEMQRLADLCNVQSVLVSNDEGLEIAGGELKICAETQKSGWYGETLVFPKDSSQTAGVQIWKLGENDVPLEKIFEYQNVKEQNFPRVVAPVKNKRSRPRKQKRGFQNPKSGYER